MDVEVRVFLVKGNSKLKAKANATLSVSGSRICIKGFRVHDDGIAPPWVGPPTERYVRNGKAEFSETIWIDEPGQAQIYPKIVSAYKQQLTNKSE